ncbi:MAG: four helix bundle protein [Bacteroidetes bacterium]|nr:four helix bundle protein [Bacteroidota bacterium]
MQELCVAPAYLFFKPAIINEESECMDSAEKTTTFFRFEDLRIYHKAVDYVSWMYGISGSNHNDSLLQKLNSAARDIALNIAEGSARNKSQFIYYLKMAKSSIRECLVFTTVAFNQNLFTDEHQDYSRNQLMEMTKMIGALISSLQRGAKREYPGEDDDDDMDEDSNY